MPDIAEWVGKEVGIFFDHKSAGALVAGIVGSAVSTLTIVSWANRSGV